MRESILFLLALLAGCGAADSPGYVIIENFARDATPVSCEAIDLGVGTAATEIRLVSDSSWTLLDAPQRQVTMFDDRFRVLHRTALPVVGPGATSSPTSVAVLGDTALAVGARGGLRLVILSLEGREIASSPLDFVPHSVEATAAGHVLVTPMPFGAKPPTLLMRYDGVRWDTLPVPKRAYQDMMINALGNSTLVETLPDGTALVVHQFLQPRAFRVGVTGAIEPLALPTPDGTRDQLPYIPTSPMTEDQFPLTHLPAIDMSVDPVRSEVYILTRSGGHVDGGSERAVLRLTDRLDFIEGYTLPVVVNSMVYLPRREGVLVSDDEDRFHLCELPRAPRSGDPAV